MKNRIIFILVCFTLGCGQNGTKENDDNKALPKTLNLTERTSPAFFPQKNTPGVSARYSWRLVGWNKTAGGRISVDGAYKITLVNTTKITYVGGILALYFWDDKGYQLAKSNLGEPTNNFIDGGERFLLFQQETDLLTGTFSIELASLDVANSVTAMTLETTVLLSDEDYAEFLKSSRP